MKYELSLKIMKPSSTYKPYNTTSGRKKRHGWWFRQEVVKFSNKYLSQIEGKIVIIPWEQSERLEGRQRCIGVEQKQTQRQRHSRKSMHTECLALWLSSKNKEKRLINSLFQEPGIRVQSQILLLYRDFSASTKRCVCERVWKNIYGDAYSVNVKVAQRTYWATPYIP